MEEETDLEPRLLRELREEKGWSQLRLAQARGISEAMVSHLEQGRRSFKKTPLGSLAQVLGFDGAALTLRRRRLEARLLEDRARELADLDPAGAGSAHREALGYGLRAARSFEGWLEEAFSRAATHRERKKAERALQALSRLPRAEQRLLVESHADYQTAGLVVQLCLASERAASKDPKLALFLAQLALSCAGRVPASPGLRARLLGFAWAFVGNARRVGVGLRPAAEAFVRSDRFWAAGRDVRCDFLEEWRLPDLKASLRRDQRLWRETLALSDEALAMAPRSARGRILVKKAFALEQMGEFESALQELRVAGPLVEESQDRDVLLAFRINFAVNFTHLGRLDEARQEVDSARTLSLELGRELHLLRCLWISGRIAGESGDREEAVAALSQVRREFAARQLPLEAADVALDEAIYLLQEGQATIVAKLAQEMAWVFTAEGLTEDTLKAHRLFWDAARQEHATVDLIREVRARLRTSA